MTKETLDIVELVDNNPLIRFTNQDYNSNLIKEEFTTTEQQLFLSNTYCYLNYDTEIDFVVELHNIWKWIGFTRIDNCKAALVKHFKINKHYKIEKVAPEVAGATRTLKENIKLTVDCFKKLCLRAGTSKADEIHDYYVKLEKVVNKVLYEESEQLRNLSN